MRPAAYAKRTEQRYLESPKSSAETSRLHDRNGQEVLRSAVGRWYWWFDRHAVVVMQTDMVGVQTCAGWGL